MTLLTLLEGLINETIQSLYGLSGEARVSYGEHAQFGHVTTNVALALAKKLGKSPLLVAGEIAEGLRTDARIISADVAGPGFINIMLSSTFMYSGATQDVGATHAWSGKRALVEYTDPNPFKPFHIGHLMANSVGEFISRSLRAATVDVVRLCYPGDVGRHIAMSLYGMGVMQYEKPSDDARLQDKVSWFGKCYRTGYLAFEDDEHAKEAILSINEQVYSRTLPSPYDAYYEEGRALSFASHQDMYVRLGTTFDGFIYESEAAPVGLAEVKAHVGDIFEVSDGAVVYKGEQDGLHTRVFVNSKGLPTYEAKDVGNMQLKIDRYSPFDYSLVVTANEQNAYFAVLMKVLEKLHPALEGKLAHVGHGIMRFANGKMSSRKGTVIEAEDLLLEVKTAIQAAMPERAISDEVLDKTAVACVKFAILKQAVGSDVIFDFDKMISLTGDSAPYIMYTYSRFLKMSHGATETDRGDDDACDTVLLALSRASDAYVAGVRELAPQTIIVGLIQLCRAANTFYAEHRVEGSRYRAYVSSLVCAHITRMCDVLAVPLVEEM